MGPKARQPALASPWNREVGCGKAEEVALGEQRSDSIA